MPSASPWGCFVHPLGEDTLLVHPIEVFPYNWFVLGFKCTVNAVATHTCIKLCHFFWHSLYTCMSSDWYFSLLFWGFPSLVMSQEYPSDVHQGWEFLSYNNKLWYRQQYPFIYWINPYSENFFRFFLYMYQFPIGWTSKSHTFNTIAAMTLITDSNW